MYDADRSPPSTIHAEAVSLQAKAYEAIGAVTGSEEWKVSGKELSAAAQAELDEARRIAKAEATVDGLVGKAESAYGMVTGDQQTQTEGNLKAEGSTWKNAVADGELPLLDSQTVVGKMETAVGMATGDASRQNAGNLKVQKAEWGLK